MDLNKISPVKQSMTTKFDDEKSLQIRREKIKICYKNALICRTKYNLALFFLFTASVYRKAVFLEKYDM